MIPYVYPATNVHTSPRLLTCYIQLNPYIPMPSYVPAPADLLLLLCQNKDLREVQATRKKLSGRKLDYDCKKRHGAEAEEIIEAERKFAESYQVGDHLG